MSILSKSQILNSKLPTKDIPTPEWGDDNIPENERMTRIAMISGLQRQEYLEALQKVREECKDNEDLFVLRFQDTKYLFLSLCIVDESCRTIFSKDEVKQLASTCAQVTDRLFGEAQRFNGVQSKEAVEDIEKK